MLRAALVAFGVATIAAGAMAQSSGVTVCDDFFKKYETCINTKVPAAERQLHKGIIDELRRSVGEQVKKDMKSLAESSCKTAAEQFNRLVQPYGCSF